MNTARRSYLLHIALLCMAVLFSRTDRATASVIPVHPCTQHSSTKAAAEPPAHEKKLLLKTKKAIRRTRSSSQIFFAVGADPRLLSSQTTSTLPLRQVRQAFPAHQSRLFVLRI